jgi:hypothetical protein
MCKTASEAARLGQDFWAIDQKDVRDFLVEARIISTLEKLSTMRLKLEAFISEKSAKEIIIQEQQFRRNLTGGNFGVHNRQQDIERAKVVIYSAHRYDTTVRMTRLEDLKGFWRR